MEEYKKELETAIRLLEKLNFDKNHPWHRNLISLYCALIEYSDSLIFLMENKKNISIPLIFRGLLEAYVDFMNLSVDQTYGYNMEASYSKEWLKVFNAANGTDNEFLDDLGKNTLLTKQITEHTDNLQRLKSNGFSPLNNFQKFEKSDMVKEYKSIYNFVCSDSHNNIRSLIDRFIIIDKDENNFEIALFKEFEDDEYEQYYITGNLFLKNASQNIHKLLESGFENEFLA